MNLILILLFTYITASVGAISSHRSDFHRLNLPLYAYVMFYTFFFIPLAIFMHVFYQGYVFMYFISNFIIKIYPYRLYITMLFVFVYYLLFYITIKITEKNLTEGKRNAVILRMIFLSVLSISLLVFLYKRSFFIGSIQDYIGDSGKPLYMSPAGLAAPLYLFILFLFEKMIIPKIKRISV